MAKGSAVYSDEPILRLLDAMDLSPCDGCDQCGLRCAGPVPMTLDEYRAIAAYCAAGVSPDASTADGDERWIQDAWLRGPEAWDTPCRFRDERQGLCRIYPVRPLVCRLMGHVPWLPCPVDRVSARPTVSLIRPALDAYCRETRRPFHEWKAMEAREV